ncbi:allantoinase [Cohnella candidum]|uniref:Allantoinase n=1 Tax=Cohnella candidum TaxID=2674991 RepID=A0A3G3JZR7_9BACL|nr:allantoinase [Cohnella candidum]AYQ73367.1 allantoinase [Cohnella candidum]
MVVRFDLIVSGGNVVLPEGVRRADIGIRDGKIAAIADLLPEGEAADVLDAGGRLVLPGMIDVHVHFNEPNFGHWEGFETGSAALAAGGCTAYLDMPLNGNPPTVNLEALRMKASLAEGRSVVDYGFWGGLVPGNLDQLEALAQAGVPAFKAFLSDPGGEGEGRFRQVDDFTLYEGMKRIARFGGLLALHAESDALTGGLAEQARANGHVDARGFAASRPVVAETEAVAKALLYAKDTGCRLHFVHISTPEAVELVAEAKLKGVDVTLETCPHYLVLTEEDMERIGPAAKCAPPLRDAERRERLWELLAEGGIDMVASDHSPSPPELKRTGAGRSFFDAWGGIAGAQSSLELLLGEGVLARGLPLTLIADLVAGAPARRFGFAESKGKIAVGMDADLAIVDMAAPYILTEEHLLYRHRISPYAGMEMKVRVAATLSRGKVVYRMGSGITESSGGEPLRQDIRRVKAGTVIS